MTNFEAERYRRPPTLADADALAWARRQAEIRRLVADLIAALASLWTTEPDGPGHDHKD